MSNILPSLPSINQPSAYNACKGALSIIAPQTAINLCTNPSFETGLDNWSNVGGTLALAAVPWSGAFSASFTGGTSLTYGATTYINATAAQMLCISFYIYNQTQAAKTFTINLFRTGSATAVATWTYTAPSKVWRRFSGVALIPVTQQYYFRIDGTDFYIDACQVEVVSGHQATTYFDGSFTGNISQNQLAAPLYSWQGKAHNSPSVRSANAANGGRLVNLYNELGFIIVGITGADMPVYDNQTVEYYGTDGAALQDIITPPRQMNIIGRIYGTTREDLHRKISLFTEYFSRDTTAFKQPKSFQFQHLDDDGNAVGIPLSFSGVIQNTFQIPLGNDLGVQANIQLQMIDPYFYGHDESTVFENANTILQATFSYVPEYTAQTALNWTTYIQAAGQVNSTITSIAISPNGIVYFGGTFTQVNGIGMNYIASYNPIAGTFAGLGATPSTVLNAAVAGLAVTPDGAHLIIVGSFTTAAGAAANRVVGYNIAANTFFTLGAGAGGGVNNYCSAVEIRTRRFTGGLYPYQIFIGGAFTASTSGTAMNRMAYLDTTTGNWTAFGTGSGMNNEVFCLAYNNNLDRIYIGGNFTTSQGGAVTLNYIAYVNLTAAGTTVPMYIGFNNAVYTIYTDDVDNALYVGGSFTALAGGAVAMLRAASYTGVVWNQLDAGVDNNLVYDITKYKNGFLVSGTFTSVNGNAFQARGAVWYNGQSFYPVGFDSRSANGYYTARQNADGVLYLGSIGASPTLERGTASLSLVNNSSTAAAIMRWQFYTNADVSDFYIHALMNATQQTQISLKYLNVQTNEIVVVDAKYGNITSDIFGSQTRYLLGASGITTMRVLPNKNYLVAYFSVTTTSFGPSITARITAIWTQTFNTIFDGINAV
jgi:hypothetical protein